MFLVHDIGYSYQCLQCSYTIDLGRGYIPADKYVKGGNKLPGGRTVKHPTY